MLGYILAFIIFAMVFGTGAAICTLVVLLFKLVYETIENERR